jgi:hypothetical protein
VRNAARQCSMQLQPCKRDGRCRRSGQCHCGGNDRRNSRVSSQCGSITLGPGPGSRRFDSVATSMAAEAENSDVAALLGVLAGGMSSCTGSGGGSGGAATGGQGLNTPPGTYSIPVSVSSNGVVHKVTLILTVD